MSSVEDELELALALADAADAFTLPRFETADFTLGWKDDRSEVTEADRGAEALIAEFVLAERPSHGICGEEHGAQGTTDSPWQWIVDPIDGTSGFVRGIPVWATLIALAHDDSVVAAVVSAPALGRRWWASLGGGAFADGTRCSASDVDSVEDAQMSITWSSGWQASADALIELSGRARRIRGFGDFWQHCLVAEGAVDVAVDAVGVAPYDLAAVSLIVTEAGGRFTDRRGVPTWRHDTAVSSNGHLHDEIIAALT